MAVKSLAAPENLSWTVRLISLACGEDNSPLNSTVLQVGLCEPRTDTSAVSELCEPGALSPVSYIRLAAAVHPAPLRP